VIDLIPALLSWEGRDPFPDPQAPPGTAEVIEDLYADFRLAAVTDADRPAASVRRVLEGLGLAPLFDGILTSAPFGPAVGPRMIRHLNTALAAPPPAIVATARARIADRLWNAGMPVATVDPGRPEQIPERVADLIEGRLNP